MPALYYLAAPRPRRVFTEPLDLTPAARPDIPAWRQLSFWRGLVMYFCLFAVVGHWLEAVFGILVKNGLVQGEYHPEDTMLWRDWFAPYAAEGIGFCVCVLFLYPIREATRRRLGNLPLTLVVSFLANTIACALVELAFGLFANADLHLWGYSEMPCNFMGQICLQNSVGFGIVATGMVWVVYPFLARLVARLPRSAANALAITIFAIFIILQALFVAQLPMAIKGQAARADRRARAPGRGPARRAVLPQDGAARPASPRT